jgi:hypothetical protein
MGATSSIGDILSNNIYISCLENDVNAEMLYNKLIKLGYNTIKCDIKSKNTSLDVETFSETITKIISESSYIIICLRKDTLRSFNQVIELNHILDSSKNILYVMTDENYMPSNTKYLNGIIKDKLWLPAYDDNTINIVLDKMNLLLNKEKKDGEED